MRYATPLNRKYEQIEYRGVHGYNFMCMGVSVCASTCVPMFIQIQPCFLAYKGMA